MTEPANVTLPTTEFASYTITCIFIYGLQVWHPPIVRAGGHFCVRGGYSAIYSTNFDKFSATRPSRLAHQQIVVYIFQ